MIGGKGGYINNQIVNTIQGKNAKGKNFANTKLEIYFFKKIDQDKQLLNELEIVSYISDLHLMKDLSIEKLRFLSEKARDLEENGCEALATRLIINIIDEYFIRIKNGQYECVESVCDCISILLEAYAFDTAINYVEKTKGCISSLEFNNKSTILFRLDLFSKLLLVREFRDKVGILDPKFSSIVNMDKMSKFKKNQYEYYLHFVRLFYLEYDSKKMLNDLDDAIAREGNDFLIEFYILKIIFYQKEGWLKLAFDLLQFIKIRFIELSIKKRIHLIILENSLCINSISYYSELFIKTCPVLDHQSRSVGNKFSYKYSPHKLISIRWNQWFDENIDGSKCCWEISKKEIKLLNYKVKNDFENVLDLRSGLYFHNDQIHLLTKLRAKVLMAIIGYSDIGATDLQIVDFVFNDQFFSIHSGLKRVQDIVTQLQKLNFPIVRRNNRIYFVFDKINYNIIIPRDHIYEGEIVYLKNQFLTFRADDIKMALKINKSTAWLYIKKWIEDKQVIKSQTRGTYSFVD